MLLDNINYLTNGATSGNNILYNQDTLTFMKCETTTEGHLAVFSLSEDSTGTQSLASLMSQQNTTGYRANYSLNISILELLCHCTAQLLSIYRLLQYIELFYITWAVQTRGQQEMPLHNSAGFNQQILNLFFTHSVTHFTHSISFKIISAAAFGFSAALIGRPITK